MQRYYKQIHDMTPLSEQEMNAHLAEESRVRRGGAGPGPPGLDPRWWGCEKLRGFCVISRAGAGFDELTALPNSCLVFTCRSTRTSSTPMWP